MSNTDFHALLGQLWRDAQAAVRDAGGHHQPVKQIIPAPAFFPGGLGSYSPDGLTADQIGGPVMFIGQDFGTVQYAEEVYATGEDGNATWNALLGVLKRAEIEPNGCFFTNALLGLRASGKMTGLAPGWRDPRLLVRSQDLLMRQIRLVKPTAIFALGLPATRFLGRMANSLSPWANARSWAELDAAHPVRHVVPEFGRVGHPVAVGALLHPSLRGPNLRRRTFRGLSGEEAEARIIGEVHRRYVESSHTRVIASHLLHPADIPAQDATWDELAAFAYTFEGYMSAGGMEQLIAWTEGSVPPQSVDMARAMLYGHLRWMRWSETSWDQWDKQREFFALLEYVRDDVARRRG